MEGIPMEEIIETIAAYEATQNMADEAAEIENTILKSLARQSEGV
jgi:hypothetical protein